MEKKVVKEDVWERLFQVRRRGSSPKTELLAGITTFLTCVYIAAVNPAILSAAGMDIKAVFWATVLASAISCIWIGVWANLPFTALAPTFGQLSIKGMFTGTPAMVIGVVFAIISFLFVDLFDSIGVLLGVATKAGLVDEDGNVPSAGKALFVSAGGAAIGAILGTNTVTIYGAESTTGIAEGGRTGMTACTTGILFLFTLFLSPLFLMIPSVATAPALVMVGIFMIEPLCHMELGDFSVALPVFLTIAFMPFSYNIAYGILFGLIGYTLGQIASGKAKKLTPTVWVLTAVFIAYLVIDIIL